MARPTTGVSLAPTLTAPQAAAALQEVANTGPMMQLAVSNACRNQSRGLVRTRTGTLYATGRVTILGAGAAVLPGSNVDIFNVPVGQAGSGFAALTKAETNMTQAGQLVSEAFNIEKLGIDVCWAGADSNDPMNPAQSVIQQFLQQFVIELHLGGQDVQTLGILADWPGLAPQAVTSNALVAAALSSNIGFLSNGYEKVRDYDLYIPTATPFKINLRTPNGINVGAAPVAGFVNIRVSFYGTSMTAIQG